MNAPLVRVAAALISAALLPAAHAASSQQTAYWTSYQGDTNTFLADWVPATFKVDITDAISRASGSYTDDGTTRLVTLRRPAVKFEGLWGNLDSCGNEFNARTSVTRYAFTRISGTDRSGTTAIHTESSTVALDGCDVGSVVASTALTDVAPAQAHLKMSARPAMTDIVPGLQIAGFSASAYADPQLGNTQLVQSVTDVLPGQVRFNDSGLSVSAGVDADNWLMLGLPTGQRGYTRLSTDSSTGAETWIAADFVAGKPAWVMEVLVTKTLAGATFGSVTQAAHVWNSGIISNDVQKFEFDLYRDMTGQRVFTDLVTGVQTINPLTWAFSGNNIVQTRTQGSTTRWRTWVPLANRGKIRWVMESELWSIAGGPVQTLINPRLNFYTDEGRATPPVPVAVPAIVGGSNAAVPAIVGGSNAVTGAARP